MIVPDPSDTPNTTTVSTTPDGLFSDAVSTTDFWVGLVLACASSIFIGASFIFKKKGLIRLQERGVRAGQGGYGYLKEPMWWAGMLVMAAGEGANFAAYIFAPATLVTPLGALSVLAAAVLASKFLKERLNILGKFGCALCLVGSTFIVVHSPKETGFTDLKLVEPYLAQPGFLVYLGFVVVVSVIFIFALAPRWGSKYVMVYITICSAVGSIGVMAVKGVGIAIKQTVAGEQQFTYWLTYVFIAGVIICISIEMVYLNRALDQFNTSLVTPIYYVVFTILVIIASALLFQEWSTMQPIDVLGNICGFLIVIGGIFLLNSYRDMELHFHHLTVNTFYVIIATLDITILGLHISYSKLTGTSRT